MEPGQREENREAGVVTRGPIQTIGRDSTPAVMHVAGLSLGPIE